ncbi:VOC family protein [Actinomadura nitritigenes]|uniref:VOC family protein n=1 Tax=Actinomadura nitritigenes TaxID=134602 RepID=UPI003D9359F7
MACRITELVIDCRDPETLAAFWCAVLDYAVLERDDNGDIEIGPAGTELGEDGLRLVLSRSDEPRRGKLPLHFDVNATDRDQDEELQRLFDLGARTADVGQTGEESWHVLADPEGNEFCLLRRRVEPARSR